MPRVTEGFGKENVLTSVSPSVSLTAVVMWEVV
jgi:hypothetical protein